MKKVPVNVQQTNSVRIVTKNDKKAVFLFQCTTEHSENNDVYCIRKAWYRFSQKMIDKTVLSFDVRLKACIKLNSEKGRMVYVSFSTSDFPRANVGFSGLKEKYLKIADFSIKSFCFFRFSRLNFLF